MAYRLLSDLFPTVSRSTRYRWRKAGKIRKPDIVIGGREYWDDSRPLIQPNDDATNAETQSRTESAGAAVNAGEPAQGMQGSKKSARMYDLRCSARDGKKWTTIVYHRRTSQVP